MIYYYSVLRFMGFVALCICLGFSAQAQRPPLSVVYDSLGRPIRANHEIIVSFRPSVINRAAVSSRNGDEGPLSNFIKPAFVNGLETRLGMRLASIYAIKVASGATPADSVFIDLTGQTVAATPLWNMLLLCLPAEMDDYAAQNALRQQGFNVVQYASFNYMLGPASSSAGDGTPFLLPTSASKPLAYPLPVQDILTFALPQPLPASAELTILTPTGQVMHTEKHRVYQNGELVPLQVNVASLPVGQYFYRLTTPTNTYQGRFEKQN